MVRRTLRSRIEIGQRVEGNTVIPSFDSHVRAMELRWRRLKNLVIHWLEEGRDLNMLKTTLDIDAAITRSFAKGTLLLFERSSRTILAVGS